MPLIRQAAFWLELFRPLEWSKSFTFMVIGSTLSLYLSGNPIFTPQNITYFLTGLIALILLWSAFYALNDLTDIKADRLHPVKNKRPLAAGKINPQHVLVLSGLLMLVSFFLAYSLSAGVVLVFGLMGLNQLMYTFPPVRLKDRPILDLLSGSVVGSVGRFSAGWFLFSSSLALFPIVFVLGLALLQLGSFIIYKSAGAAIEKSRKVFNSLTLYSLNDLLKASNLILIIGLLLTLYALYFSLPHFIWWTLIVAFLPLPFYAAPTRRPDPKGLQQMYKWTYFHVVLYGLSFVGSFWWFA